MQNLPELPINLGDESLQCDGVKDVKPFFQSHRGKRSESREYAEQPTMPQPEGFGRYYV